MESRLEGDGSARAPAPANSFALLARAATMECMEELTADVVRRVTRDFPEEDVGSVLRALPGYRGPEGARMRRCLVHLSAGSAARLRRHLETAVLDYRDTIYQAEYDCAGRHLRNFGVPFP